MSFCKGNKRRSADFSFDEFILISLFYDLKMESHLDILMFLHVKSMFIKTDGDKWNYVERHPSLVIVVGRRMHLYWDLICALVRDNIK